MEHLLKGIVAKCSLEPVTPGKEKQAESTGSGKRSMDAGKDDAANFSKELYLSRIIYILRGLADYSAGYIVTGPSSPDLILFRSYAAICANRFEYLFFSASMVPTTSFAPVL